MSTRSTTNVEAEEMVKDRLMDLEAEALRSGGLEILWTHNGWALYRRTNPQVEQVFVWHELEGIEEYLKELRFMRRVSHVENLDDADYKEAARRIRSYFERSRRRLEKNS